MKVVFQTIRMLVTVLPGLLFFSLLIIPHIDRATGLFYDGATPWYAVITAPLFLAALVYAYPVTRLCMAWLGDDSFLSPVFFLVLAVYSLLLGIALQRMVSAVFRFPGSGIGRK